MRSCTNDPITEPMDSYSCRLFRHKHFPLLVGVTVCNGVGAIAGAWDRAGVRHRAERPGLTRPNSDFSDVEVSPGWDSIVSVPSWYFCAAGNTCRQRLFISR